MENRWEAPKILAEFNLNSMKVNDVLGDWGEWANEWNSNWTETAD